MVLRDKNQWGSGEKLNLRGGLRWMVTIVFCDGLQYLSIRTI